MNTRDLTLNVKLSLSLALNMITTVVQYWIISFRQSFMGNMTVFSLVIGFVILGTVYKAGNKNKANEAA